MVFLVADGDYVTPTRLVCCHCHSAIIFRQRYTASAACAQNTRRYGKQQPLGEEPRFQN